MKVISILQPWATLIVLGHKKIETRSWNTKYRGPLLIHASAGKKKGCRELMLDFQQQFYHLQLPKFDNLPFGAIIGQVNLIDTEHSELLMQQPEIIAQNIKWEMTAQEEAFGDYSPNRYGWLLSDPVQFNEPILVKGKLGLWEYKEVQNA